MGSLNDAKVRALRRVTSRQGSLNDLEKEFWEDFDVTTSPGDGVDLSGLTDRRVPFVDGDSLADSPIRVMDDGNAFITGTANIEGGTLAVGPFIEISERGGFVGVTNGFGDQFTIVDYRTPTDAASSKPRLLEYTEAENDFVIQPIQTEILTSPVAFVYQPTLLARTNALRGQVGDPVTNLRLRIRSNEPEDNNQVIKYFPSEADWIDGTGMDFGAGEMTLDFGDTQLPLNGNTELHLEIRFDTGTLLGDTNGVPWVTAQLQRGQFTPLALEREIVQSDWNETDDTSTAFILNKPDITGGGTPEPVSASISRFGIQGQSTSVLAGTTLTGLQTFTYNVNHPEDVNGNLTLRQGVIDLRTDIDPTGSSFTQTITDVTLGNNQEAVFRLSGETNEGILLSSFFRVRAHLPAEQLFYGQSTTNNPAAVDTSDLSHIEAGIDGSTITTGATTQGNFFIVLVPSDHDLTSIEDTVLGQDVTSVFTKTDDVRTISGVSYNSYVFGPVNAGASESYTVRF